MKHLPDHVAGTPGTGIWFLCDLKRQITGVSRTRLCVSEADVFMTAMSLLAMETQPSAPRGYSYVDVGFFRLSCRS